MKKFLLSVLVLCFASNAFAIAGIGAHYLINTGSLKGDKGKVTLGSFENNSITADFNQNKSSSLSGLGFKLWIDILPFVDIEGTFNMAFASYSSELIVGNETTGKKTVPVEIDLGVPFYSKKAKPVFSEMNGDLSITYPFTMLPIIRPYLGAGLSYMITTPVVNAAFMQSFLDKTSAGPTLVDGNTDDIKENLARDLTEFVEDVKFTKGFGFHLIAGARAKLPIIPIAAYINTKYYFGGNLPKKFDNGLVLELGGGFAL